MTFCMKSFSCVVDDSNAFISLLCLKFLSQKTWKVHYMILINMNTFINASIFRHTLRFNKNKSQICQIGNDIFLCQIDPFLQRTQLKIAIWIYDTFEMNQQ